MQKYKKHPQILQNLHSLKAFQWSEASDESGSPCAVRPWCWRALVSSSGPCRGTDPGPRGAGWGAGAAWPGPTGPSSFGKQLILKCFTITKITAGTSLSRPGGHSQNALTLTCCFSRLFTQTCQHCTPGSGAANVTQGLTPRVLISCKFHSLSPAHRTTPGELEPENRPGFCGNLAQFLWGIFYHLHQVKPSDNSQWSGMVQIIVGKRQTTKP